MKRRNPHPGAGPAHDPSVAGSFAQLPPRQLALAVSGVMLAMFLSVLNQTIVATAMPRIIADLGGFDRYTWVATAYLVASAVAIPIVGRLSDIYGRRVFLILGLVILTLSSIPAGLSQSMNQLIAARALQGIGGGIITASSFTAAADLFPPRDRGRFQAYAGLVFGIAAILGALLGGLVTNYLAWNWIFLLNVPVGVAVLAVVRAFPKIPPEVEDRRLDYPGMATLVLAVVSVMVGLSWGTDSPAAARGLLLFGVGMAAVFVIIESTSDCRIMPLEIYRNRTVAVSLAVVFLSGFGLYASLLFVPLFFQVALGTSAAGSGGVLVAMMFGLILGAVVSGQLIARTGGRYRAHAVASTGVTAAGLYLLSAMNEDTSLGRAMGCIFLAGAGVGGTFSVSRLAVQNSVPFRLVGAATAAVQFYRLLSGTMGLAVLGAVLRRSLSTRLDDLLPDGVKAALPPGRLDAIRNDPWTVVEPLAADALTSGAGKSGDGGAGDAETLLASLNSALAGAVGDVFTISAGLVVLSLVAAVFLRQPRHATADAGGAGEARGPGGKGHRVPRNALIAVISVAMVSVGAVGMKVLVGLRQPPPRQVVEDPGFLVRVLTVQPQDVAVTIEGFGTVRARHLWSVVPEVSGTVERLSPFLRAGLPLRQGDLLFEIDPRPYRLAVRRNRARIQRQEKEIAVLTQQRENHAATLQLARRDLAIADEDLRRDEELARLGAISTRERNRRRRMRNEAKQVVQNARHLLALTGPRIEQAQAALAAARADLESAELELAKTRVLAPFDGVVATSTLDPGEFVGAGREVAALSSAGAVEIPVSVPVDELRWLSMPTPDAVAQTSGAGPQPPAPAPAAVVRWRGGGREHTWRGGVSRREAGFDPETRTMTLVVEVPDPWASLQPGAYPALLPGMFCRVEVAATTLSDVVVIPRTALYDGNTVFLAEDGRLAPRQVEVTRLRHDEAVVSAGLRAGDKLVVTVLTAPVAGAKLRVMEGGGSPTGVASGR